jgi:hypothetical protein
VVAEELRETLVEQNLAALRALLSKAVFGGANPDDLVLFIADMRDGRWFAIAKSFAGATEVDRDRAAVGGVIPTVVGVMPLAAAKAAFENAAEATATLLDERPKPGLVRLVIVAVGRVQLRHVYQEPGGGT